MSNALINNSTLEDIADAIRAKLGSQETMRPSEMAGNIGRISGGGGASTLDLLWTNPSPNVSFSAQTVSIDLTDYSAVVIVGNGNDSQVVPDPYPGSTKPTGNQCFVMKGADGNIPFGSQIAGAATYAWRKITVSDSGVVFGAGYLQQGTATSGSVNNVYATPLKIYGIKLASNS